MSLLQINGVNVTHIPARDEYAYRLSLMDVLFIKQEIAGSLLFPSKKKREASVGWPASGKISW